MSDGYTTFFNGTAHADAATDSVTPAYGQATVTSLDGQPLANPVQVYTFAAMIDPTRGITLRDESIAGGGGLAAEITVDPAVNPTDVFDGWVPAYGSGPPPAPEITVQVPATRANHEWALFSDPARQPASYPWPNPEPHYGWPSPLPASERATYAGVNGMANYAIDFYTVVLPNSTPYFGGPFLLQDFATLEPHDVSAGPNDLRQWFTAEHAVHREISTSRFGHQLRVRHPNGEFFAITQLAPAVNGSLGQNRTIFEVPYYFFNATSSARAEMPWYVEDVDAGERIGPSAGQSYPSNDDLIRWIYVTPPSGLTAQYVARTTTEPPGILLQWTPGEPPTGGGFIIERRESMDTAGPFTQWHELERRPYSETSWRDIRLVPGEYAIYRVRAFFGSGENERHSTPSNHARSAMWIDRNNDGILEPPGGDDGTVGDPNVNPPGGGDDGGGGNGGGPGNPGIPGDGDGDGDPDNDKDGVVDTGDNYPDDPKRSEDIPVKFYGVIDLSQYEYQGDPVKVDDITDIAIDDDGAVSWLNRGEEARVTQPPNPQPPQSYRYEITQPFTITTWREGAIANVETLTSRSTTNGTWNPAAPRYDTSETARYYHLNGVLGSGLAFGDSSYSSSVKYTRTLPYSKQVPGEFLNSHGSAEPDDWSYYEDEITDAIGISYTGVTAGVPALNLPAVQAGTLWYIEEEGGSNRQKRKVFRDRGTARAYFPDDHAEPGPLSNTALVLRIPADPPALPRTIVWKNDGTQIEPGVPAGVSADTRFTPPLEPSLDPKAINDQDQLVGPIRNGWEDPDDEFPDGSGKTRPGRGELGFLWNSADGTKVFHDLLPEKFRKQMKNAVPFLISNKDTETDLVTVHFTAESWEGPKESPAWVPGDFVYQVDSHGEATVRKVDLPQTYDADSGQYRPISVSMAAVNKIGMLAVQFDLPVAAPAPGTSAAPPPPPEPTRRPGILSPLQILDKNKKPIVKLKVAKMVETGVISGSTPPVTLDPEKDSDRFYVRFRGTGSLGTVSIKLATVDNPEHTLYDDDATEIDLHPDGGDAISKSLLLVADDVDDDHPVDSIDDDAKNDRTHKVQLGGNVKIARIIVNGTGYDANFKTPVPAEKTVEVKVWAQNGGGVPAFASAEMQAALRIAKERFAQVATKLKFIDKGLIVEPTGVNLSDGLNVNHAVENGLLVQEEYDFVGGLATKSLDDIEMFVIDQFNSGTGQSSTLPGIAYALTPPGATDEKVLKMKGNVVISWKNRNPFTIPHEIGHILLETPGHESDFFELMRGTTIGIPASALLQATKRLKLSEEIKIHASPHAVDAND